jgi:hypothetical protein
VFTYDLLKKNNSLKGSAMIITALQSSASLLTATKSTISSTSPTSDSRQIESASKVTISSDAARRARVEHSMRDVFSGRNNLRAMVLRDEDISSPATADLAHTIAYEDLTRGGGVGGLLDISGTLPGGDGILRYSSGEPVTEESKAYFNKEEARFRQERIKLYESELGKGTPPGQIVNKLYDLQAQQPERFRMMNMWPVEADVANNS